MVPVKILKFLYNKLVFGQPFQLVGERLFARAAHGLPPLGKQKELCLDSFSAVFGPGTSSFPVAFECKYYETCDFSIDPFIAAEEGCTTLIKKIAELIGKAKYKIVGSFISGEQNNSSFALIKGIKALSAETLTFIGGINCDGEMAEGMASACAAVDYIFSGESETSFSLFLEKFSRGVLPSPL